MEKNKPKKGEIYRHFKGHLYEILAMAKHTGTGEDMVIYEDTDTGNIFARPLESFMSPVDKVKYPDAGQEYRFELQNNETFSIIEFLEINTASGKLKYLEKIRPYITEQFISMAAQSLDFTEKEGSADERYHDLVQCLKTLERYEKRR